MTYVAGMTDRYAFDRAVELRRLGPGPAAALRYVRLSEGPDPHRGRDRADRAGDDQSRLRRGRAAACRSRPGRTTAPPRAGPSARSSTIPPSVSSHRRQPSTPTGAAPDQRRGQHQVAVVAARPDQPGHPATRSRGGPARRPSSGCRCAAAKRRWSASVCPGRSYHRAQARVLLATTPPHRSAARSAQQQRPHRAGSARAAAVREGATTSPASPALRVRVFSAAVASGPTNSPHAVRSRPRSDVIRSHANAHGALRGA